MADAFHYNYGQRPFKRAFVLFLAVAFLVAGVEGGVHALTSIRRSTLGVMTGRAVKFLSRAILVATLYSYQVVCAWKLMVAFRKCVC